MALFSCELNDVTDVGITTMIIMAKQFAIRRDRCYSRSFRNEYITIALDNQFLNHRNRKLLHSININSIITINNDKNNQYIDQQVS